MEESFFKEFRSARASHGIGSTPSPAAVALGFAWRGWALFSAGKVSSVMSSEMDGAALPFSLENLRYFMKLSVFSEMPALPTAAKVSARASTQRSKRRRSWALGRSSFREDEEVCFFIWPKISLSVPANAMGRPPHPGSDWILWQQPTCLAPVLFAALGTQKPLRQGILFL